MNLSEISTNDLKDLRLYQNYLQDPIFQKFIKICKNDEKSRENMMYISEYCSPTFSFFVIAGYLIPQILLYIFCVVYQETGVIPAFFFFPVSFIMCLVSVLILAFNFACDDLRVSSALNLILTVATYVVIRFFSESIFQDLLLSIVVQFLIREIDLWVRNRKYKKNISEYTKTISKNKPILENYERFYEQTAKEAQLRINLFREELLKRDERCNFPSRFYWWKKPDYKDSLSYSGDFFDDEHVGRYETTGEYDVYGEHFEVAGRKTVNYEIIIDKKFFLTHIPQDQNRKIFWHIEQNKFRSLSSKKYTQEEIANCKIAAIGCKWLRIDNSESETVMRVTPDADQIANAKREIDSRRDLDEILYNASNRGAALTADELYYATGGRSYQDKMFSEDIRKNDLDKYIQRNTYDDVSHDSESRKNKNMAIFMYIINDADVYFTFEPPFAYISPSYTFSGGKNWLRSRQDEIEAAFHYMITHDEKLTLNLVGNILGGHVKEEDEILTSKILHTFANCKKYDKYFS